MKACCEPYWNAFPSGSAFFIIGALLSTLGGNMGLQEIAVGGIFLSPMLMFALMGFVAALIVRWGLHRFLRQRVWWHEAWFDASLFIVLTAASAFALS